MFEKSLQVKAYLQKVLFKVLSKLHIFDDQGTLILTQFQTEPLVISYDTTSEMPNIYI